MIKLLATDLDRTLLPNGNFPYDNSMPLLKKILSENKNIKLAFVSGRHLALILDAIKKYDTPIPDYIVSDVGTTIYKNKNNKFTREKSWDKFIKENTKNWNIDFFKEKLASIKGLRLQEEEKQNIFKLSYYIDNLSLSENIIKKVEDVIKEICGCEDALIVYSIDETTEQGLLDILPRIATKQKAIEYLRSILDVGMDDVLYCGDSGNDILPLTQGYNALMVRNTISSIRKEVKRISKEKNISNKIYIAKGYKNLNGYYTSGVIEGLVKFGFVKDTHF
jgi:sucrose-6F-phosphate phosphohydrolase